MAAFGLPSFAAGVFMLPVGGMLAFGRSWTTLDTTQRLVIKQWGLLVPFRERTYP